MLKTQSSVALIVRNSFTDQKVRLFLKPKEKLYRIYPFIKFHSVLLTLN